MGGKRMDKTAAYDMANIPTKYLVEELAKREGVSAKEIAPHEPYSIADTGPCVVLVVID